jgi:hypothetical protein
MTRHQCAKCPWKVSTNPHDIPDGYCAEKHAGLKSTIAEPANLRDIGRIDMVGMACHETTGRGALPCVGWMYHQLGDGNNIALRMDVTFGHVDGDIEVVGEQHPNLEATLPKETT